MRRCGVLAALALLLAADAGVSAQARRIAAPQRSEFEDQPRIAVVVGVGAYPPQSDLPTLKYTVDDAEAVATELKARGYKVISFLNEAAGAYVVREALEDLVDGFPRGDGTLVFYFAGHGVAEANKLYLATHNTTQRSIQQSGLALDEIDALLKKTGAKRRIMWVDACRNTAPAGSRSAVGRPRTALDFAMSDGTRALFATAQGMPSFEYDDLKHGVFTHFLVKGLNGEAAHDGYVTFDSLASYVTQNVRDWTFEKSGRSQVPYQGGEHSGDFLIAKHAAAVAASAPGAGAAPPAPAPASPPVAPVPAAAPDATLLAVRKLHDEERWDESLPMLNRLLVQQPSNAEMLALRAHTYSHLQRPREAVADGEAAVRSGPTLAEAYLRRGEALMGENKLAEAIADFEKALKLNPNEVEAWGNLGASYNGLGQHQKGLDAINRGLKLPNPRYDLWFTRAVSYHAMGNHKAALDDLTEAIRLKPNSPMLLRGRAAVYRDAQQLELALRDANEALRVGPDDPEGLAIRGSIYVLLGNRDGAIADFRYALRLKPDFTDVSDALRQLEPAAEPAASSGGASPGITYARLLDDTATAIRGQRYAEANELIEQMIRLDPSRSDAWALRGLHAMNSLDNLPAAYESYQNALARGGSIYFRLAHDHGMDEVPCFGMLTVNRSGAVYAGETGGHQFQWDYAAVREAAMNEFYGSAAGMFHIKAQMPDGTKSFNFIVVRAVDQQIVNRRPDAEMLLGFLNRLKQSSGR